MRQSHLKQSEKALRLFFHESHLLTEKRFIGLETGTFGAITTVAWKASQQVQRPGTTPAQQKPISMFISKAYYGWQCMFRRRQRRRPLNNKVHYDLPEIKAKERNTKNTIPSTWRGYKQHFEVEEAAEQRKCCCRDESLRQTVRDRQIGDDGEIFFDVRVHEIRIRNPPLSQLLMGGQSP